MPCQWSAHKLSEAVPGVYSCPLGQKVCTPWTACGLKKCWPVRSKTSISGTVMIFWASACEVKFLGWRPRCQYPQKKGHDPRLHGYPFFFGSRFAALLLPIALLLAIQSTDQRQSKPFRQKCHNLLSKFQPAFLVNVGLQADYSAELLRFLRTFDCSDHDPAKTYREKSNFASRLLGSPGNLVISD